MNAESGEITVVIHTSPTVPSRELTIKNIFPFMTLQDIKLAIYVELKQEDYAIPEFSYLCMHFMKPVLKDRSVPIDYTWNDPTLPPNSTYYNLLPFNIATGARPIDNRFVESSGDRKLIPIINRERLSIEDAFLIDKPKIAKGIPDFHVYFYRDVLEAIPGPKPPSEKDWNGRLYPFFPSLSVSITQPTSEHKATAKRLATIFTRRQQFLMRLQSLLDDDIKLEEIKLAAVKYLVLMWPQQAGIPGIEAQFYEAAANERRPFIRLIPADGSSISKVYLKDGKNPDIQDPKVLLNWAQERSPTPETDYAYAKILVRKGISNLPALYASLMLFNDGTAKCIVEPPKPMKKLEPLTDLNSFGETLKEGLQGLPYIAGIPDIYKASLVLGIKLKNDKPPITSRILRERLPVFTSFFQEIAPLRGESPLIMLRYKLVSNFANEDRIQTFITQVMNRKIVRGEAMLSSLPELVADEFQIDIAEARKQVATKLQIQGQVALVNPASNDYMHEYNPGIDVGIFAQHPFYTFHLHRVNSVGNLQRIITALSLMISAEPTDLVVSAKAAKELEKAEQVEAVEEVKEIAKEVTGSPAEALAPAEAAAEEEGEAGEEMPDYLDYFAFGEEEEAVAAAAAKEGTPYPEVPSAEEQKPAPPVPVAAAPLPVEELKRAIGEDVEKPKEELAHVAEGVDEDDEATGEISIANYFLRKLQDADGALFDYHKKNPALKRYVSKCQPTHGRQPAVLNEAQFQRMEEEYRDEIVFQLYPLEPGEPEKPAGKVEKDYYTVLRYGTTPQKQNYYICCRYFCIKDEILVREKDLESTEMRRPKGTKEKKKAGQCPFCKGTIIENQKSPRPTDTILERAVKPKTDQRHLYIRFMKSTPHPDGFYLPCCFLDESPVKFSDPAYDKYRQWGLPGKPAKVRPANAAAAAALKDDEEDKAEKRVAQGPRQDAGIPILDYFVIMASVTRKYIIGAEKFPLEIPVVDAGIRGGKKTYIAEAQVGLLPPVLDSYFEQDQTQLVSRSFNPQKIKPDGQGFLRAAVENRVQYQADSFLAAIAPFYRKNSVQEMKDHLDSKITARVFMSMNYGNAVLEFYDPSTSERPPDGVIDKWAEDELEINAHRETREALVRAYLSFHAFKEWLQSDTTKKEFRHFAPILAQANLIREGIRPGITFIVLDILKSGKMSVRCPPMGYNTDLTATNDVGFLLHHWSGIWEPLFYVDARQPGERGLDNFTLIFQMAIGGQWPDIVKKRFQEYTVQCNSMGRSIYTSQSAMNPMSMIPCSLAVKMLRKEKNIVLSGVLRDAYNHIGALLYKFKETYIKHDGYIALPVIDDGAMITNKDYILDWDDPEFIRPQIDILIKFYELYVETHFAIYRGYSPIRLVRTGPEIIATQLRNGLYVPAKESTADNADKVAQMPSIPIDEMEWAINHEIALGKSNDDLPGKKERMKINEFYEVFEHLRLTFSNWLAAQEAGGDFRTQLENIIYSRKLPLFEKRKRMLIHLSPVIKKWITTEEDGDRKKGKHNISLMRVDCRIRSKETCSGRCTWKREGEEEKCLLHAPKDVQLAEGEDKRVSSVNVLLLRLIEELLRYGERRRQILEQKVSRVASMDNPIMIEGNQKIYPEKSAEWYELLRLEWATQKEEQPKFYEEMVGDSEEEEDVVMPPPKVDESMLLPPSLQNILNGDDKQPPDVKTAALRLFRAPLKRLFVLLGVTPEQFDIRDETLSLIPDDKIREMVKTIGIQIVQINLQVDPPNNWISRKPARPTRPGVPVFVATMEGPALLMLNPNEPSFLTRSEMPRGLVKIVDAAKTSINTTKKSVAAQPAEA